MQWIVKYLTSSIGKKQIMGCTGALLAAFVFGHMVGNIQLLNPDPAAAQASYNSYCQLLTGYKPFIYSVELVMICAAALHIFLAVTLKIENKVARGSVGYDVNAHSFMDFYDSKGWMVGKTKMKDWQAAVRTWAHNEYGTKNNKSSGNPFLDMLQKGDF